MFQIIYAHCIDDSQKMGYVFRTVDAQMFRVKPNPMIGETEDTFELEVDGVIVGYGDSKADAISEAKYRLMDRSRSAWQQLQVRA